MGYNWTPAGEDLRYEFYCLNMSLSDRKTFDGEELC